MHLKAAMILLEIQSFVVSGNYADQSYRNNNFSNDSQNLHQHCPTVSCCMNRNCICTWHRTIDGITHITYVPVIVCSIC